MGDNFVENKLREWNLSDLIDDFKKENIDEEAFKMLDNETIDSIIKKAGPRLKFKAKFKLFNVENWVTHSPGSASTETLSSLSFTSVGDTTSNTQPGPESPSILLLSSDATDYNNSFMLMPPPLSPQEEPTIKKRRYDSVFQSDLEDLLSQTVDGRQILTKKKEGSLNNTLRNKLVNIIISYFINIDKNITPNTFQRAAEEITKLFNRENVETYYIPYKPKTNSSPEIAPKGKLYSKYVNVRAHLTDLSPKSDLTSSSQPSSSFEQDEREPHFEKETLDKLSFLKQSVQPWDKILEYWRETVDVRKKQTETLSIAEYLESFPALRQNEGYVLIELDFKNTYPDKENVIYVEWPKISKAIIKEASLRKIKLPFDQLSSHIDTSLLSVLYLAYLFPPVTIGNKKNNKNWRPSKLESQESFILLIPNLGLLEEKLDKRRNVLRSANLTLQPFFVCVNDDNDMSYFVIINDVKYVGRNLIRKQMLTVC